MWPALDLFSVFIPNFSSFAELTQCNKYVSEDDIMLYLICFNETKRWRKKKCEKIFEMWSTAGAGWHDERWNIRLSQWAYVVCMLFIIMRYTLIRCLRKILCCSVCLFITFCAFASPVLAAFLWPIIIIRMPQY